jgi:hypothetical protein
MKIISIGGIDKVLSDSIKGREGFPGCICVNPTMDTFTLQITPLDTFAFLLTLCADARVTS